MYEADRRSAYRAARQWAAERYDDLPDDRMIDAALQAVLGPDPTPDQVRLVEARAEAAGSKARDAARLILRTLPTEATVAAVGDLLSEMQRWKDAWASECVDKDRQVRAASKLAMDCEVHGEVIRDLEQRAAFYDDLADANDAARIVLLGWYHSCVGFVRQVRANQSTAKPLPTADTIVTWMERQLPRVKSAHQRVWAGSASERRSKMKAKAKKEAGS